MKCSNCSAELPRGAKFCSECGQKVTKAGGRSCTNCGSSLKPGASFCHNCGTPVGAGAGRAPAAAGPARQSWLASYGAFLFIPIFAGIIVLLFWANKEPEGLSASNPAAAPGAPNPAAMQQVHQTLDRLQKNLEANPKDLVSIDSLAVMYAIAGSYDKARQYYERHLEIEPENRDIKIALALTYHNLNQSARAIDLIKTVLDKEPTYFFALFYLGEIHASLGHKKLAEQYWQKIVDTYPGTEWAKTAQQRIHDVLHPGEN
ncbi:MAG: zinc-ribbon domain-containing protein [Calditrichaeota bacterium]|nr:MAG: zinc-ribbon domain-containing protein [Calditrichota bacterium]